MKNALQFYEFSEEIRSIAREEFRALLRAEGLEARDSILRAVAPVIEREAARQIDSRLSATPVIQVRSGRTKLRRLPGPVHSAFSTVLRTASSRTSDGFPVPVWMYGPPGSGKTSLANQVAKALGAQFYLVALGPTSTEARLLGYTNLATGQFVEGSLCKPFREGGLAFLDEIDVADPGVLVGINALISNNSFRFANGETVSRHRNFYLIAGGNTTGAGGVNGFTRNKLDAAFLDRFVKIKVDYDHELEAALCSNQAWVKYVQRVRNFLAENSVKNVYITPRATLNGAAMLDSGIPADDVAEAVLLATCGDELKRTIKIKVGRFTT